MDSTYLDESDYRTRMNSLHECVTMYLHLVHMKEIIDKFVFIKL